MEKLLKGYLSILLVIILSLAVISIFSLRGEATSLEKIYLFLLIVLILILVALVSGVLLFLMMYLGGFPGFKQKDISQLDITPSEIAKLSQEERKKMLAKLEDKREEVQQMIELTKKKFYQRELDQDSFKELIKEHEKNLISIESKINKIKRRV